MEKQLLRGDNSGVISGQTTPELCSTLVDEKFGGFVSLFLFPSIGIIVLIIIKLNKNKVCEIANAPVFCNVKWNILFVICVNIGFGFIGYMIFLFVYYYPNAICRAPSCFKCQSCLLSKEQKTARIIRVGQLIKVNE